MKNAVVIFFDEGGAPVDCKLACHKKHEQKLEAVARVMMQAAIDGPHICACGGKCKGSGLAVAKQ